MQQRPSLVTSRLRLRPIELGDAADISRLAGEREIASTTRRIPHPYTEAMAQAWIASLPAAFEKQELCNFAITLPDTQEFIGSIGLILNMTDLQAELGYWIGKPYWNHGYATESALAIVAHAFEVLSLHRIFALHMTRNPASGRVMQKIGMKREGLLKDHRYKWGKFEDLAIYGMTVRDYKPLNA